MKTAIEMVEMNLVRLRRASPPVRISRPRITSSSMKPTCDVEHRHRDDHVADGGQKRVAGIGDQAGLEARHHDFQPGRRRPMPSDITINTALALAEGHASEQFHR